MMIKKIPKYTKTTTTFCLVGGGRDGSKRQPRRRLMCARLRETAEDNYKRMFYIVFKTVDRTNKTR